MNTKYWYNTTLFVKYFDNEVEVGCMIGVDGLECYGRGHDYDAALQKLHQYLSLIAEKPDMTCIDQYAREHPEYIGSKNHGSDIESAKIYHRAAKEWMNRSNGPIV